MQCLSLAIHLAHLQFYINKVTCPQMTPTRYNHRCYPGDQSLIIFSQVNCYSSIELNHLKLKSFAESSSGGFALWSLTSRCLNFHQSDQYQFHLWGSLRKINQHYLAECISVSALAQSDFICVVTKIRASAGQRCHVISTFSSTCHRTWFMLLGYYRRFRGLIDGSIGFVICMTMAHLQLDLEQSEPAVFFQLHFGPC